MRSEDAKVGVMVRSNQQSDIPGILGKIWRTDHIFVIVSLFDDPWHTYSFNFHQLDLIPEDQQDSARLIYDLKCEALNEE